MMVLQLLSKNINIEHGKDIKKYQEKKTLS